jgi:GDPmannose 4,6-dehydratase/GDP-4-dehydro-6-deoxy-D-mannose reductase
MESGMRALITGITGFVGSHLAEYLLARGDVEVFGIKRWRSPLDNVSHVLNHVTLFDCDLRDTKSMLSVMKTAKPDRIYHLAAQSYVPASFVAPVDTFETNACGTINMLEAVRLADCDPIIHICSSSEVYGQVASDEVPIKETNPLRPSSPYAASKVAEDMIGYQYFVCYHMKIVRTRAFTHTGPRRGDVFVESSFAKQIAEIETGNRDPVVHVGNLKSVRTFLDVRDICDAYYLTTERGEPGAVYNIGGSRTMSIEEMLNYLLSLSAKRITVRVDPARLRPADVTLQIPDVTAFTARTHWQPRIPFEQTMQDLLEYWRNRVSTAGPR